MKHNKLHGSTRNSEEKTSALNSLNAADTARIGLRLSAGGNWMRSFAAFTAKGRLSEKTPLQTAFCFNDLLLL